MGITYIGYTRR